MARTKVNVNCGLPYPNALWTWELDVDDRFPCFGTMQLEGLTVVVHVPTARVAGLSGKRAVGWALCRALTEVKGDWLRPTGEMLRQAEDIARVMCVDLQPEPAPRGRFEQFMHYCTEGWKS